MNILIRYTESVLTSNRYTTLAIAYRHRVEYMHAAIKKETLPARTIDIPYALNDLGVREFKDLSLFAKANAKRAAVSIPTSNELYTELMAVDLENFSIWIDAAILLTGDYYAILKAIQARKSEIISKGNYTALIYSGTAIAFVNPDDAIALFDLAAKKAPTPILKVTAYHRAAVTALKRKREYQQARQRIHQMLQIEIVEMNDRLAALALIDNLYSLLLIMENDTIEIQITSEIFIANAHLLSNCIMNSESTEKEKSQAARYRSQIAINYAQLLEKRGDKEGAIRIFRNNLVEVVRDADEYYCEAVACLAYALYLNDEYTESIIYSKKAIQAYSKIGKIDSLKTAREVLLGAYEKSGNHTEALQVLKLLQTDPLGEQGD